MEGQENPKDARGRLKPQIHLIPPVAIAYEAVVMELGASRYNAFNWRAHPVKASVYYSAANRHLMAWLDGEDNDPESGVSHVAHARACTGILLDAIATGNIIDDRPLPGKTAEVLRELTEKKSRRLAESENTHTSLCGFSIGDDGKLHGCVVVDNAISKPSNVALL